jgi:hypothetical protein
MTIGAFLDGIKRTVSAPGVLLGVFALTFAMALPLALTLRGMLRDDLGSSVAADAAADGVNFDWWLEFLSRAAGIGATFAPPIIGFAAVLDNIGGLMDGRFQIVPVASALGAYLLVWTFVAGGILDRYARGRPTRAHGFFGACGMFFPRFLRLGIIAALAYGFLFAYVHPWLFENVFRNSTQDLTSERQAFAWRVLMYVTFAALLVAVNVLFDYAKVRAVVEDRRSMLGALTASARFIRRNAGRVLALYALSALLFLVVIGVWALVAPGAGRAGLRMWWAFGLGQAYVTARLFAKLQAMASQTSLFQSSLAHAPYTAVPEPVWPESPAAETIAPARR